MRPCKNPHPAQHSFGIALKGAAVTLWFFNVSDRDISGPRPFFQILVIGLLDDLAPSCRVFFTPEIKLSLGILVEHSDVGFAYPPLKYGFERCLIQGPVRKTTEQVPTLRHRFVSSTGRGDCDEFWSDTYGADRHLGDNIVHVNIVIVVVLLDIVHQIRENVVGENVGVISSRTFGGNDGDLATIDGLFVLFDGLSFRLLGLIDSLFKVGCGMVSLMLTMNGTFPISS
ncbi:hypothetical protein FPOAC2_08607 [Fusarium poae]